MNARERAYADNGAPVNSCSAESDHHIERAGWRSNQLININQGICGVGYRTHLRQSHTVVSDTCNRYAISVSDGNPDQHQAVAARAGGVAQCLGSCAVRHRNRRRGIQHDGFRAAGGQCRRLRRRRVGGVYGVNAVEGLRGVGEIKLFVLHDCPGRQGNRRRRGKRADGEEPAICRAARR